MEPGSDEIFGLNPPVAVATSSLKKGGSQYISYDVFSRSKEGYIKMFERIYKELTA